MKRIFLFFTVLSLTVVLPGCGGSEEKKDDKKQPTAPTTKDGKEPTLPEEGP